VLHRDLECLTDSQNDADSADLDSREGSLDESDSQGGEESEEQQVEHRPPLHDVRQHALARGHVIPPHLLAEALDAKGMLGPQRIELPRVTAKSIPRPRPPRQLVREEVPDELLAARAEEVRKRNAFWAAHRDYNLARARVSVLENRVHDYRRNRLIKALDAIYVSCDEFLYGPGGLRAGSGLGALGAGAGASAADGGVGSGTGARTTDGAGGYGAGAGPGSVSGASATDGAGGYGAGAGPSRAEGDEDPLGAHASEFLHSPDAGEDKDGQGWFGAGASVQSGFGRATQPDDDQADPNGGPLVAKQEPPPQ